MTEPSRPEIGEHANKAPREPASLQEQLARQIGYLQRSAALFDDGFEDEAQRMAVTIRTLLHDTRQSTSLLAQLSLKQTPFVDTGTYRERLDAKLNEWVALHHPGNIVAAITAGEAGLVVMGLNRTEQPAWIAPLGFPRLPPLHPAFTSGVTLPFEDWWTMPLIETGELRYFSRRQLVLIMANQDGGAHVDPSLDRDYHALTLDNLGREAEIGDNLPDKTMGGEVPSVQGNVAAQSVRQIAFEVLATLLPDQDHSHPVTILRIPVPIIMSTKADANGKPR
jgi:hypothetical protein